MRWVMYKQARWGVVCMALAAALALGAGCHGGTNAADTPSLPELPGQAAVDDANAGRLDTGGDAEAYTVKGTLSVKGLTLLNSEGAAVPAADALPELDARLLDPEEDILSQVKPGLDGSYNLTFKLAAAGNTASRAGDQDALPTGGVSAESSAYPALLVVSGTAEEDLDGDGEGGDAFSQEVPLTLLPGLEVTANLELSYGDTKHVDPTLVPEEGGFMVVSLDAVDADGAKDDIYGVFFADATTVFDTNGDNFLAFGDYLGADEDLNGVVDDFTVAPADPGAAVLALEGQITAVDPAALTIKLRDFDGVVYTLQLQQFTPVELWDIHGTPIGVIPLGPELIGRYATAEGPAVGLTVEPYQVVVYQES